MQLLEQAGCPLKTERGNRVFPVSDHSSDVIRALERLLQREGVKVHLHSSVKRVLEEDGQAVGLELSDGKRIQADSVIDGDGRSVLSVYRFDRRRLSVGGSNRT